MSWTKRTSRSAKRASKNASPSLSTTKKTEKNWSTRINYSCCRSSTGSWSRTWNGASKSTTKSKGIAISPSTSWEKRPGWQSRSHLIFTPRMPASLLSSLLCPRLSPPRFCCRKPSGQERRDRSRAACWITPALFTMTTSCSSWGIPTITASRKSWYIASLRRSNTCKSTMSNRLRRSQGMRPRKTHRNERQSTKGWRRSGANSIS